MSETWFTAKQLAGLPGMPGTERRARARAEKNLWPARPKVRGKGVEYPLTCLPKETQAALLAKMVYTVPPAAGVPIPSPAALPAADTALATGLSIPKPAQLKDWQRNTAEARAALVAEVKRLAEHGGTERAVMAMVDLASQGRLPEHLQALVPAANARSGKDGKRTLSRRSLYRWLGDAGQGFTALAPKNREKIDVPAWAPALLKLRQVPQGVNLAWVVEQLPRLLTAGVPAPSYGQARRFLDKLSTVEREAGRKGPREIKSLRPFVRRDTRNLWPGDVYTADGHTFDAEVAHPLHGKPFRPELTTVLDVATRYARGWSAGLAESTWAVLDALRHACETGGIPAIFYVDNGSGYKNAMMANEATGFLARLGITMTHSLPYNSQARGIIERAHQTIWVRGAKTLPTYMGADMDREAKQKVFKITRADIKAAGASRLLMPWAEFVAWCQDQIDAYNNRPHRALPKVRDPQTGKLRHQTPAEAWASAIEEGWQPVPVESNESADLFRPYKECKVSRGEVRLFNNTYFSADLEHHHGETVRVGYDIHDAGRVWVRDDKGRLICVAEFEANRRSYFPQSFIEQAAQKRAEGRIKRAQARIDEAEAELDPPALLEHPQGAGRGSIAAEAARPALHQAVEVLPVVDLQKAIEAKPLAVDLETESDNVVRLPEPKPDRPMFETDAQKYRWLRRNPECVTSEDERWIGWYRTTSEWEDLFGEQEGFEVAAR